MTNDELPLEERIARDRLARRMGHASFADAPPVVQRNIANRKIELADPMGMLRPEADD